MSLKVKVGPIGLLDMLKFANGAKARDKVIAKSNTAPLDNEWHTNDLATYLHPQKQELIVKEIIKREGAKSYVLARVDKKPVAFFRAGQYLSIGLHIGKCYLTRPYTILSSPMDALKGTYTIMVKEVKDGFASDYILKNWKVGSEVITSGPEGAFYYEGIRDEKRVIALAGGSGITPFLSLASAINDGNEDFDLTILYGSKTEKEILYKKELDELVANCQKVHVVYVLSDEEKKGYEHGFLSKEIIEKYAKGEKCTYMMCGPLPMYRFLDKVLDDMGIIKKDIRKEVYSIKDPSKEVGYPKAALGKKFKLIIHSLAGTVETTALSSDPILVSIEKAGVKAPSKCRGGMCDWCRSKLIKGSVYVPAELDGRRGVDASYGYIHPCVSYPTSDIELEIPEQYLF